MTIAVVITWFHLICRDVHCCHMWNACNHEHAFAGKVHVDRHSVAREIKTYTSGKTKVTQGSDADTAAARPML